MQMLMCQRKSQSPPFHSHIFVQMNKNAVYVHATNIELWKLLKMLKKTWLYTQNCQDSCQQHSDTSHHPWQNGWHLEVWLALAVPVELCETVEGNQAGPRPQLPHSLLSKKLPMKIYIFQANVENMTKARMCYKPVFQNKFIYIASLQSASAQLWWVPIHYYLFQPPILYSDWHKANIYIYISCLELMMAMFDTVIFNVLTWRAKVWCKELQVVLHKAVTEVSEQETYRRCGLLWIRDGRAKPLIDRKVVGVVFAGVVAMVAVVTSPTTAGCSVMYCNCSCSCSVVEL